MKGLAVLAAGLGLAAVAIAAPPLQPSPDRSGAMPPGPETDVKLTESYAKLVGRDVYFWAFPMLSSYGRRVVASRTQQLQVVGTTPQAPLNRLGMATRNVAPTERTLACPDLNLASGLGVLALDVTPVVLQVPYFGDRFWFYQVLDARGDSFAHLGTLHGTEPGAYLLVGPKWQGEPPKGIKKVFRSSTDTGLVVPRVYQDGTIEGNRAIQGAIELITMYPVAEYDGKMQTVNWKSLPGGPAARGSDDRAGLAADAAFDVLADVLDDAPPLPGEEARYAQVLAVLQAAQTDPKLKAAMIEGAKETQTQLVDPLFAYRNFGRVLPYHWRTLDNAGAYGTDYFTRTAVARSNAFYPSPDDARTYDVESDGKGLVLNGANAYTLTFPKDGAPSGLAWFLSVYNDEHQFESNEIKRYMLGSMRTAMKPADDGSLTIYIQAGPPSDALRENWLPAPRGNFSLVLRVYAPKGGVVDGSWTPPAVVRTP